MTLTVRVLRRLPTLLVLLASGCFLFISAPNDLPNGTRTDDHGEACHSSFAASGYCCNRACDGVCESCAKKDTGLANGTCAPVFANYDPYNSCSESQSCNGAGACSWTGAGTCSTNSECISGFCSDHTCCTTACDGECVSCSLALNGVADGTCASTLRGFETDDECPGSLVCNGGGSCYSKSSGIACNDDFECVSGVCNGACCSATCGVCQSCAVDGTVGQCIPIPNGEDPRQECPEDADGDTKCNGNGRCNRVMSGTPCDDDNNCDTANGYYCCDRQCHKWQKMALPPIEASEDIEGAYGTDDGYVFFVVYTPPSYTSDHSLRLVEFNGTAFVETNIHVSGSTVPGVRRIQLADATSSAAQIAMLTNEIPSGGFGFDTLYRRDPTTSQWYEIRLPAGATGAFDVAVIDSDTFYVRTDVGLHIWHGGFSDVPLPTGVLLTGKIATTDKFAYFVSSTRNDNTSGVIFRLLGATAEPIPSGITFGQVFKAQRGLAGAPSYIEASVPDSLCGYSNCTAFLKLTDNGLESVSATLNASLGNIGAVAGPTPHLFRRDSQGYGVDWSFDGGISWKNERLYTTGGAGDLMGSVNAPAACTAFTYNTRDVYKF